MNIKDILEHPAKYIKVHMSEGKFYLMLTLSFISILENAHKEQEELKRYKKLGSIEELEQLMEQNNP